MCRAEKFLIDAVTNDYGLRQHTVNIVIQIGPSPAIGVHFD